MADGSTIPARFPIAGKDTEIAGTGFVSRHIGPDEGEIAAMLAVVGETSLQTLTRRTVPAAIATDFAVGLPEAASEAETLAELRALSRENVLVRSLIGCGYHGTHTPPVIQRNVLENPAWYTAYTPYQAEIAQGRLEALLNFQTMVAGLTGLPVANASLLDEATAAAEAVTMAQAVARKGASGVLIADDVHPQTRAVIGTRAAPVRTPLAAFRAGDAVSLAAAAEACEGGIAAVVLQYPGTTGGVRDLTAEIEAVHAAGALAIVAADPLALVLLASPGSMGADVVVGSAQRFGVPMGFGGPHAAFFATRETFRRSLPGRIVGVSIDAAGRPAMRLALQTREQHIRREKATSNICTAQVLLAVMAGFYAAWHGPDGLRTIAQRVNERARRLADAARHAGRTVRHDAFFDTVTVEVGEAAGAVVMQALASGFNIRDIGDGAVSIAFDETVTEAELIQIGSALGWTVGPEAPGSIPPVLRRREAVLPEAVFSAHRSEHAMLRYIKRLADRDIALDRSMIPLGSCTMKLNATAEMMPITWPEFADLHPFAPPAQTMGSRKMIARLEGWLATATGFDAVSLQPNAGSQGELAGLLAIRAFHASRGDQDRDVCLIPASAHGTNPASAVMTGMRVVVVACDREGNVDLADLRAKAATHADRLAALMVTYPSTHGVFEGEIREICAITHAAGGQVYMDGANLNAQLGLTSPAAIGADVCHLNLHKTFCIPHGGGGPGVGPIAVASHLAPFLPNHPMRDDAGPATGVGPVSAAPFGSAGILPISYAYIRMMGAEGLKRASEVAILSANYVAHRLGDHYRVLYLGANGTCAHECIVDCRGFEADAGIKVEDIAKRLQDYGFHAPTMSWPVPGTLMIEPTESETQAEIDRFCDAMIAIRAEIADVAAGRLDRADNPLRNAPHTADELTADEWTHAYPRSQAAFPLGYLRQNKYWPPVKRVDNAYGDRNLVCTCAPLEAYAQAAE
jgi:glycine dehydrogenase